MAESAMRQALIMSQGSPLVFFRLPIALPVMTAALIIFFWPTISGFIRKRRIKVGPG
jgi:TctA family transporter